MVRLSGFVFLLFAVLCMFHPCPFVSVFQAAVFFRRRALTVPFVVEEKRKKTFFFLLFFCFFSLLVAIFAMSRFSCFFLSHNFGIYVFLFGARCFSCFVAFGLTSCFTKFLFCFYLAC